MPVTIASVSDSCFLAAVAIKEKDEIQAFFQHLACQYACGSTLEGCISISIVIETERMSSNKDVKSLLNTS